MKQRVQNLAILPVLIAGLGLMLAGRATAQTFTNLHSFTGTDGSHPHTSLILSSNILYGTTDHGGSGNGMVFAVNTDGTGFTNLHTFHAISNGSNPDGGLILSGNILYGTTIGGSGSGAGMVFAINTDGTGFTNLYNFTPASGSPATNSDGTGPQSTLVLSDNTLYGAAYGGGSSGYGTLFAVNTDGTSFTNLHNFTGGSDGANPVGGVILSGNMLYGTAYGGGNSGKGTVFAVHTDGTGFTNLYGFTGSGGANTYSGLILSGNTLYGTAYGGGGNLNAGTVFAINTDGTGFTNLHSFTVIDGTLPRAGLFLSGNILYGTASSGGVANNGTLFKIKTDGTGFTNLHKFTASSGTFMTNSDGANPYDGLILSGSTLYGTARLGGSSGNGTIFSLSFGTPQISITLSETNVILTWPTNATWFTLQSATNADSSVWNTVSPGPVVVSGQNTVTNPISDPQRFYRLSQ